MVINILAMVTVRLTTGKYQKRFRSEHIAQNEGRIIQMKRLIVIASIVIVLFAIIPGQVTGSLSTYTTMLLIIIALISFAGLISEMKVASYSLNMIHWIFFLVFYFIAPISQATLGFRPWGISMDSNNLERTSLLLILWILVYLGGVLFGKRILIRESNKVEYFSDRKLYTWFLISILCALVLIRVAGLHNMFTRAESETASASSQMSTAVSLIMSKCTRAVIVFLEAILVYQRRAEQRNVRFLLVGNTILLIICCFPTALARNTTGIIYLGLFVFLFYNNKQRLRSSIWYIVAFLGAIIVVFPVINVFRRIDFSSPELAPTLVRAFSELRTAYLSGNYDAFAVITAVRHYVEQYGATNGSQLLGAAFFFIPRTLWAAKPIGSGAMVAASNGMTFTNISCPLISEGYINFGVAGVILFAFIAGCVCTVMDRKYWQTMESGEPGISFIEVMYPFLLPSYFFVLRGDLLSSWSYTFAYIITFWVLYPGKRVAICRRL